MKSFGILASCDEDYCIHGECEEPNICKCEHGWWGDRCNKGKELVIVMISSLIPYIFALKSRFRSHFFLDYQFLVAKILRFKNVFKRCFSP